MNKTGILLVNLGTPDSPERASVYKYLKQFLLDPRVIDINALSRNLLVRGIIAPFRSGSSAKLYKILWNENGSPIKHYGFKLKDALQKELGDNYMIEIAMRYQSPSIESSIKKLQAALVNKIVVLPLFPHYASASTGSVFEEVMRVLRSYQTIPELHIVNSFPTNEAMIKVFASNARKYNISEYDHVIFSYHGLPQRQMIKGDRSGNHCMKVKDCCTISCKENELCYAAQCYQTSYALAKELNIPRDKYVISFQSRLGRDPWMQPYTDKVIEELQSKGAKKLLVFSPAFVADCLETTVEIGHEYKDEFMKNGGEKLDLVESLNDNKDWVKAVADIVKSK